MENSQQTHNIFFDKISAEMKATTPEKIIKDLDIIIQNEGNGLTLKQYELLGSLAYLTGIDFTSQTTGLNPQTLRNVTDRFESQGITAEVWTKFLQTIQLVSYDTLIESKDLLKSGVTQDIKIDAQTVKIKHEVHSIIKSSYVPVKSVMNIDQLLKAKNLTHMHLLNFNSIVYEQMVMKGTAISLITKLLANKEFIERMTKANNKFDDQKFALIYFDSLVTLLEFKGAIDFDASVLFNNELIEELKVKLADKEAEELAGIKTPEEIKADLKIVAEENPKVEYDVDDPDPFLKASLEEAFEAEIKTVEDLDAALNIVYKNEDLMQHIYKYIRTRQKQNRKDIFTVYGFTAESIVAHFDPKIKENVDKYNALVKRYIEPIPENLQMRIINAVNDTIRALLIRDADLKGFLIQQIHENQITTYKQLHETIGFIERCDIDGGKLNTYVALRDMIMFSNDIVNIFEESVELEALKLNAQFFTAIRDFYGENIETPEASNPAE